MRFLVEIPDSVESAENLRSIILDGLGFPFDIGHDPSLLTVIELVEGDPVHLPEKPISDQIKLAAARAAVRNIVIP